MARKKTVKKVAKTPLFKGGLSSMPQKTKVVAK